MTTRLLRIVANVAILAGLLLVVSSCGGDDEPSSGASPATASPTAGATAVTTSDTTTGDPVVDGIRNAGYDASLTDRRFLGKSQAPVKVQVFEDFQCPYCLRFTAIVEPILIEEYVKTGKVQFEFRHFVIIGAESQKAAVGAQCAAEQDRFWEYHRALFLVQAEAGQHKNEKVNVGRFADPELERLASTVGLDVGSWKTCYQSTAAADAVAADIRAARDAGLRGTPGFVVNGAALPGVPADEAAWRKILDAAAK